MLDDTRNISVELPEHLLEKLGNVPADRIRELLEKHVEGKKISEVRKMPLSNSSSN